MLRSGANVWGLIGRFLPHLRGVRAGVAQSAAADALQPVMAAALLWAAKLLIDDVFIAGRMDLLPVIGAIYVGVLAAKLALDYAQTRIEAGVAEQITRDVRTDLHRHVLMLSPGSLGRRTPGDLLTHLSGDVRRVETMIYSAPLAVFSDLVSALVFLGFLLILSWKLTLCALLVVPFLVLVSWRISPRVRRAARVARHDESAWMSLAEERMGALPVVHAFGAQAAEAGAFLSRSTRALRAEIRTVKIQAWMSLLIEVTAALGGLAVIFLGAWEIRSGALTVGAFIAFLGSVGSLYGPARGLAKASGRFQRAAAGAQRVADILDTPSLVVQSPAAQDLEAVAGAIEFRNVSFAYQPGAAAITDVSFAVEPGETVALVGPSGGGKSTLIGLLLRLHDPVSGAILIDGMDLRDVTLDSLRRNVAVAFQEPHVFRGSIADNIRYGHPSADDDILRAAARAAQVEAFLGFQGRSYGTQIGPRGGWLSGGQRQRLALARALLRDAPILLLDEATSAIDSESEDLVHDAIRAYRGRRTLLMIAHRLSSVLRADWVIVIESGRIVETGPPQALLAAGSRFRELFAAQLIGEEAGS